MTPPVIVQLKMSEQDIDRAEEMAKRLGYSQTAYTSGSELWGLFCLNENPKAFHANSMWRTRTPYVKADLEDLQMHDLADAERKTAKEGK